MLSGLVTTILEMILLRRVYPQWPSNSCNFLWLWEQDFDQNFVNDLMKLLCVGVYLHPPEIRSQRARRPPDMLHLTWSQESTCQVHKRARRRNPSQRKTARQSEQGKFFTVISSSLCCQSSQLRKIKRTRFFPSWLADEPSRHYEKLMTAIQKVKV